MLLLLLLFLSLGDFSSDMLKSKTFVKKTRSGGILKVVREHYLRDDIWCGSEGCAECQQESAVLQKHAWIESSLCAYPHYLIPDTNVVLHQVTEPTSGAAPAGQRWL